MKDEKLGVKLPWSGGELILRNPIIAASGTFGYGMEFMPYGDLSLLGGFAAKGLSLRPMPGNPMPRITETVGGMLNSIGLQNCGAESFIRDILPLLPTTKTQVIANIYAHNPQDFAELAGLLSAAPGLAALEVNISCPNVAAGGLLFGQDPRAAAGVTEAVKKRAGSLPVIVKLTPNVTDITEIAKACADGGADVLSCINTLSGMAVDARSRKPRLAKIIGGLSGAAIKPVALRCVWQTARAVRIPVIGIGGINTAEDILEFILAGAWAVQIGTANFAAPDRIFSLPGELASLMDEWGIESCATLRGTLED
ncbi:MAG: dihydroorotate dehydrogenase [Deltaproteobacteria bacterium]|jgi:dihydroorotate dehydrogenase (NAD+) catalytic subunit|nr:dihydroorotate dehydrogenase [Deltaproteobacteria bacterium]